MFLSYIFLSIFIVSLISFIGILTLIITKKYIHAVISLFISFAVGTLLGDVIFHLFPELIETYGFPLKVSFAIIGGILVSFIIEKIVHWRHYAAEHQRHYETLGIMNLFGDFIHNFIDGIIIAGSYIISIPAGIATTIAVIFHEIPQELGDFAVLLKSKFSMNKALTFNFLVSLSAFFGALFVVFIPLPSQILETIIVPFAIGSFIYIASADLIPELHKETNMKKSIGQFIFLLFGFFVMYLLTFLG